MALPRARSAQDLPQPLIKNIGLGTLLKGGRGPPSDGQEEGEPRCCQRSAPFMLRSEAQVVAPYGAALLPQAQGARRPLAEAHLLLQADSV